jgi:hypothetical protein
MFMKALLEKAAVEFLMKVPLLKNEEEPVMNHIVVLQHIAILNLDEQFA